MSDLPAIAEIPAAATASPVNKPAVTDVPTSNPAPTPVDTRAPGTAQPSVPTPPNAPAPGASAASSEQPVNNSLAPMAPESSPPSPSSAASSPPQTVDAPPVEPVDLAVEANKVGFDVRFLDFAGKPIAGLQHKVVTTEKGKRLEFPGVSDAQGKGIKMSGMEVLTPLELWIRKDDGTYLRKYKGTVGCEDMSICAVSPHIKIKVGTEIHVGSPGALPTKPVAGDPSVEKRPNAPMTTASGGKLPDATLSPGRDAMGNPVATATTPSTDANGKSRIPTLGLWSASRSGSASATTTTPQKVLTTTAGTYVDVKKVEAILQTMEQQVTWDWTSLKDTYGTSANMKVAMTAKTFNYSPDTKAAEQFKGQCYSSVKVGLWRSGLVEGVDGGVYPATQAKTWLLSQGFVDITSQLPDARWAAPGDVVTYRYDDVTLADNDAKIASSLKQYDADMKDYPAKMQAYDEAHKAWRQRQAAPSLGQLSTDQAPLGKKRAQKAKDPEPKVPKEPQRPQGANYGHIDVRGYDGYFSDAKAMKLPSASARGSRKGFVVNGIFRKVYDDQPDFRLKAFLKCLREWECHEEPDDSKRYFMMLTAINGSRRFTDTGKHPQEGVNTNNTAAGAYQFTLETYQRLSSDSFGIGPGFTPALQDRFAVAYLEVIPSNPLGFIRSGNIEKAVQLLTAIWSSLPGGKHPRTETRNKVSHAYGMEDFKQRHESFMQEIKVG